MKFKDSYLLSVNSHQFLSFKLFLCCTFVISNILILQTSCKTTKKVSTEAKPLEEKKVDYLIQKMDSAKFNWEWLSAKISATVKINDNANSFSATLRMRKDSIIWINISALGIQAARVLVTKDTVKLVDYINSKYAISDLTYLNTLLHGTFNFEMLQELLLGNYFSYLNKKELKSSYVDGQNYIVSTLRNRKLKRSLEDKEPNKRIIQDVWLDPKIFRVVKMSIDDNKMKRKLISTYENFMEVDSLQLAHKITMNVESEKPTQIILEYSKVIRNKEQETPFNIPEKFEMMK